MIEIIRAVRSYHTCCGTNISVPPYVFILKMFNVESLSYTLSSHFEPLYVNMYNIGLLDDAVSHYMLRLKIHEQPIY